MTRNLFDIIVVDDDKGIRDMTAEMLKEEGYFVVTVASSQEVFELLKEQSWDLIVSDVVRPGMGGIEMLKTIRTMGNDIPVILMSAFTTIETVIEAMKSGASDFLMLPYTAQQLTTSVRSVLSLAAVKNHEKAGPDRPTKH